MGAAFVSRYHPSFVTFPKSLVSFFVDRARGSLEKELDDPSVATIQAIMVLSCHEVGNGNKSRGWLYSGMTCECLGNMSQTDTDLGMAIRLAFDLALHLDMSSYVSAAQITAAEADMRCRLFWGIVTTEQ